MRRERAHIRNLVMINWRGIPFEILEMDRRLTALEGRNGAGKTTVMTAAYLLLMPDINMMKVINVGSDEQAEKKNTGLHGKLGASGACYAAFEIINPRGERCLIGAMMIPKAPQQVEIQKLFVISRLPEHVPLESILLLKRDQKDLIPTDASIIAEQATLYGGEAQLFRTVPEYGNALFELGILPMKLGDLKKRSQFNKILQTGLLGNFSNSLQRRIKEYLLPEGKDVGSHLAQMQDHMRLCRSSRIVVERLDCKIETVHGLYQKALAVMETATATIHLQAADRRKQVEAARDAVQTAAAARLDLDTAVAQVRKDLVETETELLKTRIAAEQAEKYRKKVEEAHQVAEHIAGLEEQLKAAQDHLEKAQSERAAAQEKVLTLSGRYKALRQEYDDVSFRLSNALEHWKKITMEAGLFEGASGALKNAQDTLPDQDVSQENTHELLVSSKKQERILGDEFSELRQKTENAERERARFSEALSCLKELLGHSVAPQDGVIEAQKLLSEHTENERILASAERLPAELVNAQTRAKKQADVRRGLAETAGDGIAITSSKQLQQSHERWQGEWEQVRQTLRATEILQGHQDAQRKKLEALQTQNAREVGGYNKAQALRLSAERRHGWTLPDSEAVESRTNELKLERDATIRKIQVADQESEDLRAEIEALLSRSNDEEEGVVQALGGQRLATLFDDIELEQAAEFQAKLGPLIDAIVVKDIEAALQTLAAMKEPPQETWLLERGKFKIENLRGKKLDKLIAVTTDSGVRATRLARFPKLGHQSRKAYVEHLQKHRHDADARARNEKIRASELEDHIEDLRTLSGCFAILTAGDPTLKLRECELQLRSLGQQQSETQQKVSDLTALEIKLRHLVTALSRWLPEGYLLDEEDYSQTVVALELRIEDLNQLRQRLREREPRIQALQERMGYLRFLPPSEEDVIAMRRRQTQIEADLDFWSKARQALEILAGNLEYFRFAESHRQRKEMVDPTAALQAQSSLLREQVGQAEAAADEAKEELSRCDEILSASRGAVSALEKNMALQGERLETLGVPGDMEALNQACRQETEAQRVYRETGLKQETLATRVRRQLSELEQKKTQESAFSDDLISARKAWKPAFKMHRKLTLFFRHSSSLARLNSQIMELTAPFETAQDANGAAILAWGELKGKVQSIEKDVAHPLRESLAYPPSSFLLQPGKEQLVGGALDKLLEAWEHTLAYVTQIIPADVVIAGDPGEAVEEMRTKHKGLKAALEDAEAKFRTSSKNVASTIRHKIRTETRNITRYNSRLEGISFGSLEGINISFKPREDLMRLLTVMEDDGEWNLFTQATSQEGDENKDLALSEVMGRVYRHITGGKVEGDELLDYRNYINMSVLVRRKGTRKLEPATDLSTGEAMGTGAAILMVVLQAWEDQAVIRDLSLRNNLRFLFMDEASRLDTKSIKALLEFCDLMDVQLLVAGPSFKAAETGGGITYHLARQFSEDGELVVMGARRGFGKAPASEVA